MATGGQVKGFYSLINGKSILDIRGNVYVQLVFETPMQPMQGKFNHMNAIQHRNLQLCAYFNEHNLADIMQH